MSDVNEYKIAISALAAVVVALFVYLRAIDARQEKKLDECETDRRELWKTLAHYGIKSAEKRMPSREDLGAG